MKYPRHRRASVSCALKRKGFKNSTFHRMIPKFKCQGGDFTAHNGPTEKLIYGPNTNGYQYFICWAKITWLKNKKIVFERMIRGMEGVKAVESYGSQSGTCSPWIVVHDYRLI
ncbi:unnamed protein product [Lepeophtheirus salmonis]|uniref:(salmon louse) hypothetical protein n=1 Tax=Lepeophtheirus salmonis TaxID=72036 RepID=A0A7R8H6S6_LEPSM|nr:unnamed protein product [Lepeophtheirus salmonis]CAF2902735.1 unnamed protein product [Lepeophtheirus salmonis]